LIKTRGANSLFLDFCITFHKTKHEKHHFKGNLIFLFEAPFVLISKYYIRDITYLIICETASLYVIALLESNFKTRSAISDCVAPKQKNKKTRLRTRRKIFTFINYSSKINRKLHSAPCNYCYIGIWNMLCILSNSNLKNENLINTKQTYIIKVIFFFFTIILKFKFNISIRIFVVNI